MGRQFDEDVRKHFSQTNDVFKCVYCGKELKGKPSVTRLRNHLLGVDICEKVPPKVKLAVQNSDSNKRRRKESASVNNEMPNPASASFLAQGNHFVPEQACLEQDRSCEPISESCNPEQTPIQLRARENRAVPLLTCELVGEEYKQKLEEIWSSLMEKNVFKVGIYGMAGVGKTELARHIYNRLLEHRGYDFFCWITVTPDFSIHKLQTIIANAVNFDMSYKDVEIVRAELSRRLSEKKFVIVLDDVWSSDFPLHDLGLTDASLNGCKLILTTQSLRICETINCQKNVWLFHEEGQHMFFQEIGKEEALSEEIKMVAESIVSKCESLPLMVKSMARSMKGVEDIREWRDALEEMESSITNEPFVEMFNRLKRCFENLEHQSLKHCFLYCALFDKRISREDLIEHLIVEGIIEGTGNRRAKFDRGHSLLNKLQNAWLLERYAYISMHKLIRKMSFQIMKDNLPITKANLLSKLEFSEEIKYLFMKDTMRISLIAPSIFPSDYVSMCPNVSTLLFMRGGERLVSMEDCFFDHFQMLKVLNLSDSDIEKLPKSVGGLKNLKALFLKGCECLKVIPSLAELLSLEVLDLCGCAVEEVPEGVELLSNLRVLNLLRTKINELRARLLKGLLNLEFLAFDMRSKIVLAEEIAVLPNLESLIWCFSDINEFYAFFSKTRSHSLKAYSLYVGNCNYNQFCLEPEPKGRKVWLYECDVGKELIIQEDIQMLRI